ncbi:MAG: glycosyltransferase involved in cell wall biosynthesis [Flavobacteriales bacterium]|jgi:glycosyltransferase involved in cell wall biosynthesis
MFVAYGSVERRKVSYSSRVDASNPVSSMRKMTKIAVNTRLLRKNRLEGIGWFTWETLQRITRLHPEVEFHFFFDGKPDPSFVLATNVKTHVLFPPARHILLFQFWFDVAVRKRLKKIGADLFLSQDGYASLTTEVPQLIVIHDLNFIHYPEWLPEKVAKWLQEKFPHYAKAAARIATVSSYSKNDIHTTFGIDKAQIDVVYNGVAAGFSPLLESGKMQMRLRYSEGNPYFVYVGSLHARKNIKRMLQAFDQFKSKSESTLKMLLIGEPMWSGSDIEKVHSEMKWKEDVLFLGRKELKELQQIVGGALAMVFVPLFEGFGIPALESMASGVPLLVSNNTSLPEVVGDAALQVNAEDVKEISEGMLALFENEQLREVLIQKGIEQAKLFSWDITASKLWESIEQVLHQKH